LGNDFYHLQGYLASVSFVVDLDNVFIWLWRLGHISERRMIELSK
jgi:hypothetical protein